MPIGAVLQLGAYGEQDLLLTGNPQITYFKDVYKRYTNFAMELDQQYLNGQINFGKKTYCNLERKGDLIHQIYLHVLLPTFELDIFNEYDYICSWTNAVGHAMINYVSIKIGGMEIDRHYGQWMQIWSDLTTPLDKRPAYDVMIGKTNTFLPTSQQGALDLYVPLQFWFNRHIGLSLPLIALQQSEVTIELEFNDLNDLWISNTGGDPVTAWKFFNTTSTGDRPFNTSLSIDNTPFNMQKAELLVNYIYLDEEERRWFALMDHTYLIEQVQINPPFNFSSSQRSMLVPLEEFSHPIKELIWVIQSRDVEDKTYNYANDWFNFSAYPGNPTLGSVDPLHRAQLKFEGQDRFEKRNGEYFNVVQPYEYHTYTPNNFINVYSFALNPEKLQPSGTANFSRLDHVHMLIELIEAQNGIEINEPSINFYATNYNILIIKRGQASLLYYN